MCPISYDPLAANKTAKFYCRVTLVMHERILKRLNKVVRVTNTVNFQKIRQKLSHQQFSAY